MSSGVDPAETTALLTELSRLADEACAAARRDDLEPIHDYLNHRVRCLGRLRVVQDLPVPAIAALRVALDRDAELLGRVQELIEAIRAGLTRAAAGRRTLQSYHGPAPAAAFYVERLS